MKKFLLLLATVGAVIASACEYGEVADHTWDSTAAFLPVIAYINGSPAWESVTVSESSDEFIVTSTPSAAIYTNTPLTLRMRTYSAGTPAEKDVSVGAFCGSSQSYIIPAPPAVAVTLLWRPKDGEWQTAGTRKYLDNQQRIIGGYEFKFDPGVTSGEIEIASVTWYRGFTMNYTYVNIGEILLNEALDSELSEPATASISAAVGECVIPKKIIISNYNGIYYSGWESGLSFSSIVKVTLLGGRRPER